MFIAPNTPQRQTYTGSTRFLSFNSSLFAYLLIKTFQFFNKFKFNKNESKIVLTPAARIFSLESKHISSLVCKIGNSLYLQHPLSSNVKLITLEGTQNLPKFQIVLNIFRRAFKNSFNLIIILFFLVSYLILFILIMMLCATIVRSQARETLLIISRFEEGHNGITEEVEDETSSEEDDFSFQNALQFPETETPPPIYEHHMFFTRVLDDTPLTSREEITN